MISPGYQGQSIRRQKMNNWVCSSSLVSRVETPCESSANPGETPQLVDLLLPQVGVLASLCRSPACGQALGAKAGYGAASRHGLARVIKHILEMPLAKEHSTSDQPVLTPTVSCQLLPGLMLDPTTTTDGPLPLQILPSPHHLSNRLWFLAATLLIVRALWKLLEYYDSGLLAEWWPNAKEAGLLSWPVYL